MIAMVAVLIMPEISFSEGQKQGTDAVPPVVLHPKRVFDNPPKEPRQVKPDIPKEYEGLVAVFDEYWAARKNKDYDKAYALESEEFRKTTGFEKYKAGFGKDLTVKNVRALGVKKLNEKEVIVTGSMIYNTMVPSPSTDHYRPLNDRWGLDGSAWRHVWDVKN